MPPFQRVQNSIATTGRLPSMGRIGTAQRQTPTSSFSYFNPQVQQVRVQTPAGSPSRRGGPPRELNTTLSSLINTIGGTLKPMQAVTDQLSYGDFAAPQQAVFEQFVGQNLRPEFERFQLNPFQRQYANQAAAGGRMYAGNAPRVLQDATAQMEMGFGDQMEQARGQYENMIRNLYNQRVQRMSNSPTAMSNIGG